MSVKPKHTILIVDDEPGARRALAFYLNEYEVVEADSVAMAEVKMRSHRPSVVLLDIRLSAGGKEGFLVAELLRKWHPDARIIFITAHAEFEPRSELLSAGAVAILHKPVVRESVASAVAAAIREFESHREKSRALESAEQRDARRAVREVLLDALRAQSPADAVGLAEERLGQWARSRVRVFRVRGDSLQCELLWTRIPEADHGTLLKAGETWNTPGFALLVMSAHRGTKAVVGIEAGVDVLPLSADDAGFLREIAAHVAMLWYQCESHHAAQVAAAMSAPTLETTPLPAIPKPEVLDLHDFFSSEEVLVRRGKEPLIRTAHASIVRHVADGMMKKAREAQQSGSPFLIEVFADATIAAHAASTTDFAGILGAALLCGYPAGVCERGLLGGSSAWIRF